MNALDLGEGDDLVELARDLRAPHPEDRAVQVDVLAPGQLGVEAGADFEQAADAAADLDVALGRLGDPREDLQQRVLPAPLRPMMPTDLAGVDARTSTSLSAHSVRARGGAARRPRTDARRAARAACQAPASLGAAQAVALADPRPVMVAPLMHQSTSAKVLSTRWK